ncbi:hypothetical protein KW787_01030 [Candidatus Pacearchaeota archaeon]|nr:hypothetical protein [Candidatus Pacearchaeota archaeon]
MLDKALYALERRALSLFGVDFLSFEDIDSMIQDLVCRVHDFSPDVVVGIHRGGQYPGMKVAECLSIPYKRLNLSRPIYSIGSLELNDIIGLPKVVPFLVDSPKINSSIPRIKHASKVLLVDDDCGTGDTFGLAKEAMLRDNDLEIREATLISYPCQYQPDYFAQSMNFIHPLIKSPIRYPWQPYSPFYERFCMWRDSQIETVSRLAFA